MSVKHVNVSQKNMSHLTQISLQTVRFKEFDLSNARWFHGSMGIGLQNVETVANVQLQTYAW